MLTLIYYSLFHHIYLIIHHNAQSPERWLGIYSLAQIYRLLSKILDT